MKNVNLLFIGNSYSRNLETFMPLIAKEYGIKLNICNVYFGGCSINQHVDFISNDKKVYEIDTYNFKTDAWTYTPKKSFKEVIKLMKWDYVSLQQCSIFSGYDNDKEWGNLSLLKDMVENALRPYSPNFKFIWHMTWSYAMYYPLPDSFNSKLFKSFYKDSTKMEFDIRNTCRHRIVLDKDFKKIIPSGEVISYIRRFINADFVCTPDGVHLRDKWGCFPVALGAIKALFNVNINSLNPEHFKLINYSINRQKNVIGFTSEELESVKKALSTYFDF